MMNVYTKVYIARYRVYTHDYIYRRRLEIDGSRLVTITDASVAFDTTAELPSALIFFRVRPLALRLCIHKGPSVR
jgi:hypothetical protein